MSDNAKKILVIFLLAVFILVLPLFFIFRKKSKVPVPTPPPELVEELEENKSEIETLIDSSRLIGGLPISGEKIGISFNGDNAENLVEYLSFFDFYKKIEETPKLNISSYQLPLNIKTEVVNYYDISRKLNLDQSVDDLNNKGLAIIDNPFSTNNFYDIYDKLYNLDIPFLITADFLNYYYQQNLKKSFKDIEENIFFNNLWEINRFLFERAKNRYEASLEERGYINDRVLEAQRLAAAYFATSLELLKPKEEQINRSGDLSVTNMFSGFEVDNYFFALPDYLKIDVEKELELIYSARDLTKSPVLLYDKDYKNFVVPKEYQGHAKLYNFYLTTQWLSSNFPLYYKDSSCPDCYLDFDDWRISIITASFIAQDIFDSHELKNRWARIYKTLAFFKGLRGGLTYVHYRDALVNSFGEDYNIAELFADNNPDLENNFNKFREKVLEYDFLDIEGAVNKKNKADKKLMGVKMLSDFYWPNDYILNHLSYPYVEEKLNEINNSDITSCFLSKGDNKSRVRCNGFSLDLIALINEKSLLNNNYYQQNSSYKNYSEMLSSLKSQIEALPNIWHYNNYWKTLSLIKEYLDNPKSDMPTFAQNDIWEKKKLHTAVGSWVNLQLPMDKLKIYQKYQGQALIFNSDALNYNYIEPNLKLINEQISNINMISEMFALLKISDELRSVLLNLEDMKANLSRIKDIMLKELRSESLSYEDRQFITLLGLEFKLEEETSKTLIIKGSNSKNTNYNLGKNKLLVLISGNKEKKAISVGPIFSYIESR